MNVAAPRLAPLDRAEITAALLTELREDVAAASAPLERAKAARAFIRKHWAVEWDLHPAALCEAIRIGVAGLTAEGTHEQRVSLVVRTEAWCSRLACSTCPLLGLRVLIAESSNLLAAGASR